jgi:hypothetical protein
LSGERTFATRRPTVNGYNDLLVVIHATTKMETINQSAKPLIKQVLYAELNGSFEHHIKQKIPQAAGF